jgi:metal-sulfur cluster biosynthetic enzyme
MEMKDANDIIAAKDTKLTEADILEALTPIEDPEIHLSIVGLGLIYGASIDEDNKVKITMTLTSPFCPVGPQLISQVKAIAERLPGVKEAEVELTFSPPWDPRTMASEEIKEMLGIW